MSAIKLWPVVFALLASTAGAASPDPAPERRSQLIHMVRQDCGSCHGMSFKGGLGPALTPEALRGRAPESVAAAIYWGRPGTAMPPWKTHLSESEARWIADQLREGFPE